MSREKGTSARAILSREIIWIFKENFFMHDLVMNLKQIELEVNIVKWKFNNVAKG